MNQSTKDLIKQSPYYETFKRLSFQVQEKLHQYFQNNDMTLDAIDKFLGKYLDRFKQDSAVIVRRHNDNDSKIITKYKDDDSKMSTNEQSITGRFTPDLMRTLIPHQESKYVSVALLREIGNVINRVTLTGTFSFITISEAIASLPISTLNMFVKLFSKLSIYIMYASIFGLVLLVLSYDVKDIQNCLTEDAILEYASTHNIVNFRDNLMFRELYSTLKNRYSNASNTFFAEDTTSMGFLSYGWNLISGGALTSISVVFDTVIQGAIDIISLSDQALSKLLLEVLYRPLIWPMFNTVRAISSKYMAALLRGRVGDSLMLSENVFRLMDIDTQAQCSRAINQIPGIWSFIIALFCFVIIFGKLFSLVWNIVSPVVNPILQCCNKRKKLNASFKDMREVKMLTDEAKDLGLTVSVTATDGDIDYKIENTPQLLPRTPIALRRDLIQHIDEPRHISIDPKAQKVLEEADKRTLKLLTGEEPMDKLVKDLHRIESEKIPTKSRMRNLINMFINKPEQEPVLALMPPERTFGIFLCEAFLNK